MGTLVSGAVRRAGFLALAISAPGVCQPQPQGVWLGRQQAPSTVTDSTDVALRSQQGSECGERLKAAELAHTSKAVRTRALSRA